jgi:hypothetical protein
MKTNELLELKSATKIISGSEAWEARYKKDHASFHKLVFAETMLEHHLKDYFSGFWMRIAQFIDVKKYRTQAIKAYDVAVDIDSTAFQDEVNILLKFVVADINTALEAGAAAGQALYKVNIGLPALQNAILEALNEYSPGLAGGITETTRKLINNSLTTSINVGETDLEAMTRLQQYIVDPGRALMIARTESVRAYNQGLSVFGQQTGAKKKQWHTVPGACPICSPNDGQIVGLSDTFASGDYGPPGHPNCRCSSSLIYGDGNDAI